MFLSIVVPLLNNKTEMLKTYQSLSGILGDEVELVVQDFRGLSQLAGCLGPEVLVLEEPDSGVAEANNLAVARASGRYVLFWGAGEIAHPAAILRSLKLLKDGSYDIVFNLIRMMPDDKVIMSQPENIQNIMNCHTPGIYIRRSLLLEVGGLDTKYSIATDYHMFVKLLKKAVNYAFTDELIVDFPVGGMSGGPRAFEGIIEAELIRMREYGKTGPLAALDLLASCKTYLDFKFRG